MMGELRGDGQTVGYPKGIRPLTDRTISRAQHALKTSSFFLVSFARWRDRGRPSAELRNRVVDFWWVLEDQTVIRGAIATSMALHYEGLVGL